MNNYQNNKIAVWNSHRIVQSQADETKRKLSEEKRENKKLQATVREPKKDRMRTNFNEKQKADISAKEQQDEVMQNVNVLIKTAQRQVQQFEIDIRKL